MTDVEDIINIVEFGESLKTIDRSGWILANISSVREESVAEHSYGTILISLIISSHILSSGQSIDLEKTLAMAVIHDLQESIVGDLPRTPENEQNPAFMKNKKQLEREAIHKIFDEHDIFKQLLPIWNEFVENFPYMLKSFLSKVAL